MEMIWTNRTSLANQPALRGALRTGFLRLVQGCLRLTEDGALHGGPPCGSWVWLNRGTSGRSMAKVFGDLTQPTVVQANAILVLMLVTMFPFLCALDHEYII